MSSSNDPNMTVIETPVAQGPRGLAGPPGPRGPSGDQLDISPDEGNRIEQRANGIYSPPVEMPEQPQSSLEDIDDAVNKKHEHENKEILDGFSYQGDQLHYNDKPVVDLGELPNKVSSLEVQLQTSVGDLQDAMGDISLILDQILGEP